VVTDTVATTHVHTLPSGEDPPNILYRIGFLLSSTLKYT
jgi:hypothetical protein